MNKKSYISKLTNEDISKILNSANFYLADNLKDKNGNKLENIKRYESGKILCRCYVPATFNNSNNNLLNTIAKTNSKLAKKLLSISAMTSSMTCGISDENTSHLDIIFIEDFCAYFPFEEDDNLSKSLKIIIRLLDIAFKNLVKILLMITKTT